MARGRCDQPVSTGRVLVERQCDTVSHSNHEYYFLQRERSSGTRGQQEDVRQTKVIYNLKAIDN